MKRHSLKNATGTGVNLCRLSMNLLPVGTHEREQNARRKYLDTVNGFDSDGVDIRDLMAGRVDLNGPRVNGLWAE